MAQKTAVAFLISPQANFGLSNYEGSAKGEVSIRRNAAKLLAAESWGVMEERRRSFQGMAPQKEQQAFLGDLQAWMGAEPEDRGVLYWQQPELHCWAERMCRWGEGEGPRVQSVGENITRVHGPYQSRREVQEAEDRHRDKKGGGRIRRRPYLAAAPAGG